MKSAFLFFVAPFVVAACGPSLASEDQPSKQPLKSYPSGFVFCSDRSNGRPVWAYSNLCEAHPMGRLACGEQVSVVRRHKDFLLVLPSDLIPRYVPAASISQRPEKFVPFDNDSGVPDAGPPDCPTPPEQVTPPERVIFPHAVYAPDPEYSLDARKKKINGTVVLSLTVGVDGRAHDIKVEKGLGYGLDEKAVEAVSRWKFEPALKDSQPFEKQVKVQVTFRLY